MRLVLPFGYLALALTACQIPFVLNMGVVLFLLLLV